MPLKTASVAKLARKLLQASGEQTELLRMHDFKTDVASHDDDLHDRLCLEFSSEVDQAARELSKAYGRPFRTGAKDCDLIPVNGVVRYAVWKLGARRLFVAAAREEREVPFLLLLGVISGDTPARPMVPKRIPRKKQSRKPPRIEKPLIPGLRLDPRQRCLYLALKPGETPEAQQDAVYEQWGLLYKKWMRARKGNVLGGLHGPTSLLTLPDDESFGDFIVSSSMIEEPHTPLIEQGLEILRETARAMGRGTARIEKGKVFACDDGRRIPLAECAYRHLRTDADYRIKARKRKNHVPKGDAPA